MSDIHHYLTHDQSFREALTMVGAYLLSWGQLETVLASGFHNIAPHRRGPHVDPKDVSRTLSHLAKEWGKEIKKIVPQHKQMVDALTDQIIANASDRNTVCHGWQGVITHIDDPEFTIACWHKFHETRSTGVFPKQCFYERSLLRDMIRETELFRRKVQSMTQLAQIELEKARAAAESSAHQTQAPQDTPHP